MPANAEEESLDVLRREFSRCFAVHEPHPYGRSGARHQGYSDNVSGVQWNTGLDRERSVWTLGVNLEGMKYDGWPIARFIEAERAKPGLLALAEKLSRPGKIELWLEREAWQVAARPAIEEHSIGPEPPVYLDVLTPDLWLAMLAEAYRCLDSSRGHRGRGKQTVTLRRAGRKDKDVAPHLQFKLVVWRGPTFSPSDISDVLPTAREVMLPIYELVRSKSAPSEGAIHPALRPRSKNAPPTLSSSSPAAASTGSPAGPSRSPASPNTENTDPVSRSLSPEPTRCGNGYLPVTSDPAATRRRIAALDEYMSRDVLGPGGFVCSSFASCRASHDGSFFEGQLHHVGRHYDMSVDGTPLRVVIVGQEYGNGPSRVARAARSHDVVTLTGQRKRFFREGGFPGRNPHMRGTSSLLRLLFGHQLGSDYDGEFVRLDNEPVHIFELFALANFLLCSAIKTGQGAEGSKRGDSTATMRRNCGTHFSEMLAVLEPTLVIAQGRGVRRWMEPLVEVLGSVSATVERVKVGSSAFLLASFTHPSVPSRDNWGTDDRRPYLLNVVAPTVRDLHREILGR